MSIRTLFTLIATIVVAASYAAAGSITGTIKFEGTPPKMKQLNMDADAKCCPGCDPKFSEALVLGEGQTMGNILVQITKGLPDMEYPVPAEPVILTQEGCVYSPHVFAVRAGQTLKILNPDNTLHNVHALPEVNKAFNRAMPATVTEIEHVFTKPEQPFFIKCDVHQWMGTWCAVMSHPFYDITEPDGVFTIEGLEPGEYEVQAWHEKLGTQTATVTIGADETKTVDFTFALKK